MRFAVENWIRCFDEHKKQTTIRLLPTEIGHHKAYGGNYLTPTLLGEFDIVKVKKIKFSDLTEKEAKLDGFDTLKELKDELLKIYKTRLSEHTFIYQHWMKNIVLREGKE